MSISLSQRHEIAGCMVSAVLQGAGIVLAALGGVALGVQAGTNSTLGKFVGKGIAGIISFASGLLCIAIYFVVSTYGANAQGPSVAGFKGTDCWTDQHQQTACKPPLTCRDTLVGLCWRRSGILFGHHCNHLCSAARQWNCVRGGRHSSVDYSCSSGRLWNCWLC